VLKQPSRSLRPETTMKSRMHCQPSVQSLIESVISDETAIVSGAAIRGLPKKRAELGETHGCHWSHVDAHNMSKGGDIHSALIQPRVCHDIRKQFMGSEEHS
jgi:hypothetical protein